VCANLIPLSYMYLIDQMSITKTFSSNTRGELANNHAKFGSCLEKVCLNSCSSLSFQSMALPGCFCWMSAYGNAFVDLYGIWVDYFRKLLTVCFCSLGSLVFRVYLACQKTYLSLLEVIVMITYSVPADTQVWCKYVIGNIFLFVSIIIPQE
jgi:hypothetical protein